MERGGDDPDWRLDAMFSGFDAAQVEESCDKANRSMAAHAEVTDVIEKNDSGSARRIEGLEQRSTDDYIGTTRFIYDGRTEGVKLITKNIQPVGDAAITQIRSATDDDASGFAAGMRVYDGDAPH